MKNERCKRNWDEKWWQHVCSYQRERERVRVSRHAVWTKFDVTNQVYRKASANTWLNAKLHTRYTLSATSTYVSNNFQLTFTTWTCRLAATLKRDFDRRLPFERFRFDLSPFLPSCGHIQYVGGVLHSML